MGALYIWGRNNDGQIGDNTTANKSSPTSIGSFKKVYGGNTYTLALDENGGLWAWGSNSNGQYGNGSTNVVSSPISIVTNGPFRKIECTRTASFGIDLKGMIWAWGSGSLGVLGNDNTIDQSSPVLISRSSSYVDVRPGANHVLALDSEGFIWSWGSNTNGELGTGTIDSKSSPVSIARAGSYTKIAAGDGFSLALDHEGNIWSWGRNANGQLGDNTSVDTSSPVSIARAGSYLNIACGRSHSIAIDDQGAIWAWGLGTAGQLGNNNSINQSSPVSVLAVGSFKQISGNHASTSSSNSFSLALDSEGNVWSWGGNLEGQLGLGDSVSRSSPVIIPGFSPVNYIKAFSNTGSGILGSFETLPSITQDPQSASVEAGSNVIFSVIAEGSQPLWYQWRKDDIDIPEANSDSYSISNAQTSDSGTYYVSLSNLEGTANSSQATLTVTEGEPTKAFKDINGSLLVREYKILTLPPSLSISKEQVYVDLKLIGDPEYVSDITSYEFSEDNGVTWSAMNLSTDTVVTGLTFTPNGNTVRLKWEFLQNLESNIYNRYLRLRFRASTAEVTTAYSYVFLYFEKKVVNLSQDKHKDAFPKDYKGISGSELTKNMPKGR